MNNTITFGCTALKGLNKVGDLKPDANGYYRMALGGFDMENAAGAYYPMESAKHLFDNSSSFMRRIRNGNCRGEYGHPKRLPGWTIQDYIQRIMTIDEDRLCCHIAEVSLESDIYKGPNGAPIVAVMGKIFPSGPLGHVLKASLDNPLENVCFSVRSLTRDVWVGDRLVKNMEALATYDYVNEPGVAHCQKYTSPALESWSETTVTMEHLTKIASMLPSSIGLEAADMIQSILDDIRWVRSSSNGRAITLTTPASLTWK